MLTRVLALGYYGGREREREKNPPALSSFFLAGSSFPTQLFWCVEGLATENSRRIFFLRATNVASAHERTNVFHNKSEQVVLRVEELSQQTNTQQQDTKRYKKIGQDAWALRWEEKKLSIEKSNRQKFEVRWG